MSVFKLDTLRRAIGGEWLQPVSEKTRDEITGVGIDTRDDLSGKAFFAIRGEQHDGHDFTIAAARAGAAVIVIERAIPAVQYPPDVGVILVASTRQALARLALAHRRSLLSTKVIAITGSSGKTTTKQLMYGILSQAMAGSCAVRSFNNDIGVPLTLLAARSSDRYVVVEIGTNAPGEIGMLAAIAEPDIAVITNVGRAHLQGLGTIEDVAREKASLLSHLREGGTAIINADCERSREYLRVPAKVVLFGESEEADLRLTGRGVRDGAYWIEVNDRQQFRMALPGRHNALNALAAIAVARRLGVSDEHIDAGLLAAEPAPMRMAIERIGEIDLINDAYNANPDSVLASLRTFGELTAEAERRVIVLGDMLELGEEAPELHREIGRELRTLHETHPIGLLILVGGIVRHIAVEVSGDLAEEHVMHVPMLDESSLDALLEHFNAGDAVLLKGSRRIGLERVAERMRTV